MTLKLASLATTLFNELRSCQLDEPPGFFGNHQGNTIVPMSWSCLVLVCNLQSTPWCIAQMAWVPDQGISGATGVISPLNLIMSVSIYYVFLVIKSLLLLKAEDYFDKTFHKIFMVDFSTYISWWRHVDVMETRSALLVPCGPLMILWC